MRSPVVHSARSATRRTVVASIPSLAPVSHTAWERRRLVASVVSTDKEYPLVTTVTERLGLSIGVVNGEGRSDERRVGKECRCRGSPCHEHEKIHRDGRSVTMHES